MDRNSPVPLWAALSIGVVFVGGVYVFAQRTVATPQASAIVGRSTASPQPGVATTSTKSVATDGSNAGELGAPAAVKSTGNTFVATHNDPSDILDTSTTWATFTDSESFYSIRYPDLGTFVVTYWPIPLKTILGWKGVGEYNVTIETIGSWSNPKGLHLAEWLAESQNIDVSRSGADLQILTVNGLQCVVVFTPTANLVTAYLEQDFGQPLIHIVNFESWSREYLYPPFWKQMLRSFQGLPWQY